MKRVNIHPAKIQLSRLIRRAEAGEEVIIKTAGKPAAKLIPVTKAGARRCVGLLNGKFKIPDDFNAPLPESVLCAFETKK
jgi:prevent-host-death family protein